MLPNMAPGEARPVTLTVIPPNMPLPPDGTPIVDVWVYYEFREEMHIIGGFRKTFRPPVPIHQPDEPPYGESEISIEPYPPRANEPTKICTKVRNHTKAIEPLEDNPENLAALMNGTRDTIASALPEEFRG